MSYEGYIQLICPQGHHWTIDAMEEYGGTVSPRLCPMCEAKATWLCDVDVTNGTDPEYPESMPAHVKELPSEDRWHVDHYGNKYATLVRRVEPNDPRWIKLHPDGEEEA